MSHVMRKPDFCLCKNKGAYQLCSYFVFATWIVQFLFFLNPKFQASSNLCRCTGRFVSDLIGNPKDRFSHIAAHIIHVTSRPRKTIIMLCINGKIATKRKYYTNPIYIFMKNNKNDDKMSHIVRKPDFCLGENKGADQLRGNREADQRLCFRYSDSTIPLLLKS